MGPSAIETDRRGREKTEKVQVDNTKKRHFHQQYQIVMLPSPNNVGTPVMAHIELDRMLNCTADELTALVKPMSANNCERYARAILGRIGGPSFAQLSMRIVETMVPRDGHGPPTSPDEYYFAVRDLFPHVPVKNDVLGRLLFFALRMFQLRLEQHPNLNTH